MVLALAVFNPVQAATAVAPTNSATPATILVLGDSLSAEYGLPRGSGWVKLLEQRVVQSHAGAKVVNASVSGDTTAGGRSRLPALLRTHKPTHVLIELGGNDALRGLDLRATEANLSQMTQSTSKMGAQVTLLGMQVPPNYGATYARDFSQTYTRVARQHGAALVPFFLKNVADAPHAAELFQADRIHPNVQAQALMLDNVWPVLKPQLP